MSAGTAARLLGTTDRTIRRWAEVGALPWSSVAGRIWIHAAEVHRRVEARRTAERFADKPDTHRCAHCGHPVGR